MSRAIASLVLLVHFFMLSSASARTVSNPDQQGVQVYADGNRAKGRVVPRLSIRGLTGENQISGKPLKFQLVGTVGMDLEKDSDGLVLGKGNSRLGLRPYWKFVRAEHAFVIDGERLNSFLAALPCGPLSLSLNFVSIDGEFVEVYELTVSRSCPNP